MANVGVDDFEAGIIKDPQLLGGAYWGVSNTIHGPTKQVAAPTVSQSPGSQILQVGNSPDGYGKGVIWDRSSDAVLLSLFINAADGLGVSIGGVLATDYVTVASITGLASFAQDTGNPLASSIVGFIGSGLTGILNAIGVGTVVSPLINAATTFAQNQFKGTGKPTKIRDGYGYDTNGDLARQEGGILVSLPGADGPYYSGEVDSRWIKPGGPRDDAHRPPQVVHGFFPLHNAKLSDNSRKAGADGQVFVTPWDYKFSDNAQYYEVELIISKGPAAGT